MPDEAQEAYAKQIAYLEYCLMVLDETAIASGELAFLQTFLAHAKGYLSKDVTPDTEAIENWDLPENQAMIQRYITHVTQEIRLCIEEWQQAHPQARQAPLGVKLQALIDGLEQIYHPGLPDTWPQVERNGST
ncbi:MAG: hypothetical protein ETSY1_31440 [Candidatus Entotheonella factor]|uniref:Uncharacterized protein n=1 Tax=Entotheonella factor TaxID=1429438 RepID=W4LBY7_ENTF1|nr:hypothetical protein [Candidatus Entotheonella palauensis]ETW95240.1 MAG: hypothetical protein ETSY1_31440 [Candidatus Entotheonella factor]